MIAADRPNAGRRADWFCAVLLIVITLLAHGRDLFHEFLEWDDQELVARNPILNPVSAEHLKQMWTSPVQGLYTPLAYTAWAGVAAIARTQTPDSHGATLNPLPFHALNLLLHVGCVLIVFDVLLHLLPLPGGERAGVRGEPPLTDERRSTNQTASDASSTSDRDSESERLASHPTSPRRERNHTRLSPLRSARHFLRFIRFRLKPSRGSAA